MAPTASIVIPTRGRPCYLKVALASIAPQAAAAGAEVLVIDDAGPTPEARALAASFDARYEPHPQPLGLNVARNTGVERSAGELVVFVDDDVRAAPGWLQALLRAAGAYPRADVFAGPIRPRLEGRAPRSCGREGPPITALDLGAQDADARYAWGANMAIRRSALVRVGPFDVSLEHGGDEQEWQERHRRAGGASVRYVAAASVDHRRAGPDARLRSLARGAHARGRGARRFDAHRGSPPSLGGELLTLLGCVGHVARRRCPAGVAQVAHSAGRLREAMREALPARPPGFSSQAPAARTDGSSPGADPAPGDVGAREQLDDFLSGASGTVGGFDSWRRGVRDATRAGWEITSGRRLRLARCARQFPPRRRVLVLGIERAERRALAARAHAELLRSRHRVELHTCEPAGMGKFENLNRLLADHPAEGQDWLLVVDDDVALPRGFLDRLLFLCERFELQLAQPAHRLNSHAAWLQTRRRPRSVVRETAFVEIGPVTLFAAATFSTLLPFPPLRMGWGLDMHWAALARSQGWRCGVIDAVTIRHRAAPAAERYSRQQAIAEARQFLAERPYLRAAEAHRTLVTHRRW
ncbi:MAG: glycosyltransferase family 2 protein [Actinobacteria bacterium]|nr:MAG: glycosyltransferase family 2 protein [Actinomycetota bacterium]